MDTIHPGEAATAEAVAEAAATATIAVIFLFGRDFLGGIIIILKRKQKKETRILSF